MIKLLLVKIKQIIKFVDKILSYEIGTKRVKPVLENLTIFDMKKINNKRCCVIMSFSRVTGLTVSLHQDPRTYQAGKSSKQRIKKK